MISPVELPETFKMTSLHIPRRGSQTPGRVSVQPPTDLSLPSITFGGNSGHMSAPVFGQQCKLKCPTPAGAPCEPAVREVSGSWVSLLYINVALAAGLSLLFLPSAGQSFAWMVCPVWSLAIFAHALSGDNVQFACGIALAMAYPILILVRDAQLYGAYLLLFAGFSSRGFWRDQRGVWLVLCVICWAGVLVGAGGLLLFEGKPGLFEAGSISGLGLAVVCTRRLARFRYKIVGVGGVAP